MPLLAVRNTQGGIANLACLFAEDGAQQAFFGGQLGFALRRDLTDQNIAGVNLRTDTDDAVARQGRCSSIFADVRDIAGNLFRAELGISGFNLIFLDMDGGINIVADKSSR